MLRITFWADSGSGSTHSAICKRDAHVARNASAIECIGLLWLDGVRPSVAGVTCHDIDGAWRNIAHNTLGTALECDVAAAAQRDACDDWPECPSVVDVWRDALAWKVAIDK